MKEEEMENNSKKNTTNKDKELKSVIDRMSLMQRRYGMEMATIKGQARAYLFAMELKELGFKAEDLK